MDEKNGERSVQLGRRDDRSFLHCRTAFDQELTVIFTHERGNSNLRIGPNQAAELLRSQKALTPKVSKDAARKAAKKEERAIRKVAAKATKAEAKRQKKAAKKERKIARSAERDGAAVQ